MSQVKSFGNTLYFSQFGGERPIPPEFIAAMDRAETRQAGFVADAEIPADVLADENVVFAYFDTGEKRTNEKVLVVIRKKAGNITLRDFRTTDQGLTLQVDATLFYTTDPTFSQSFPSATQDVAIKDLGNGWSIQEVAVMGMWVDGVFTPGIFAGNVFEKSRPNLTPDEFQPFVPVVTTRVDSSGTAAEPTLSGTELSERQEQLTGFRKRVTIATQADPTLPVVLDKGRDTDQEGNVVSVTRSLIDDDTAAATPTAVRDVKVQQLGDGRKVEEIRDIPAVAPHPVYSKERPNLTPDEFRLATPTVTTQIDSAGTAVEPTLSGTEIAESQEQITLHKKRVRTTTQVDPDLPVIHSEGRDTDQDKNVVTVTRKLVADGTAADTPTATRDVTVKQLGDGRKVQETRDIPAVPPRNVFSRERPNLTPPEFRPAIPTVTAQSESEGTAVDPTLSGTETAETQEQINVHTKRVRTTTQAEPELPVTLDQGRDTNEFKQDVIVERQLIADATAAETATALKDVRVQQLGDGRKVQETRTIASVFNRNRYVKRILDALPEKFRVLLPTLTQDAVSTGTAAEPTLGPGELEKTSEQIDEFNKRETTTARDAATLPAELLGNTYEERFGGGSTTTHEVVGEPGDVPLDEGLMVVDSRIDPLGDGTVYKKSTIANGASWPILPFANFSARVRAMITGTKQVVAKGSTTPGVSGDVITEVREIDKHKEERIVTTQPTSAIDGYVRILHNNTNVNVPPELVSLVGYIDHGGGSGNYNENGTYALGGPRGSGSMSLRGSAHASAVAIPELGWVIKFPRTNNIPCIHVLLYVPIVSNRAAIITAVSTALNAEGYGTCTDWPKFFPQPITVKGIGGKISLSVQVAASASDSVVTDYLGVMKFEGWSRSGGGGSSIDSSVNTKIFNIPETIHGALTISGTSVLWNTHNGQAPDAGGNYVYTAHGIISNNTGSAIANTGAIGVTSSGALGIISGTSATREDNTIPDTGNRVHRLVTEVDAEFNRLRVLAEIVNFADITPLP